MNSDQLKYLNELAWGYRTSRVLQVAIKIKLFTILSGNNYSCANLASQCSAKNDILEKVLIACCSMGFLKKNNDLYSNTELSETYLIEGKPLYQGNIIAHSTNVWDCWNNLPNEILDNPQSEDDIESHRNFILGMKNITMGGRGKFFIDNIDLSARKKLLDVGGGPGTYSVLACHKYPDLMATVFDLPETIAIAREIIQQEKLAHRISVQEGNWETDELGQGYDVILFSNILHGPNSDADMKLKKAYRSMVPSGLLVIQEFLLNDTKTGPLVPALFNIMVGAYSQQEIFHIIEDCGFEKPQIVAENEEIGCSWITAEK